MQGEWRQENRCETGDLTPGKFRLTETERGAVTSSIVEIKAHKRIKEVLYYG